MQGDRLPGPARALRDKPPRPSRGGWGGGAPEHDAKKPNLWSQFLLEIKKKKNPPREGAAGRSPPPAEDGDGSAGCQGPDKVFAPAPGKSAQPRARARPPAAPSHPGRTAPGSRSAAGPRGSAPARASPAAAQCLDWPGGRPGCPTAPAGVASRPAPRAQQEELGLVRHPAPLPLQPAPPRPSAPPRPPDLPRRPQQPRNARRSVSPPARQPQRCGAAQGHLMTPPAAPGG